MPSCVIELKMCAGSNGVWWAAAPDHFGSGGTHRRARGLAMKKWAKILVRVAACMAMVVAALVGARWFYRRSACTRPVPRSWAQWRARHQAIADQLAQGNARLLWIGDSIVERFDGPGRPVWDHYYAPRNAVNMGISSDGTQHVLWRLNHCPLERLSPKLAIVMIGQNNAGSSSARQIADGVTAIVTKLRQALPETKILVLGIFYRGEKPNDEQVELAQTNDMLARLDDGAHVFYMNINGIFLNPDGTIRASLMPDFEHPNEEGCRLWAQAIEGKVAELYGSPLKVAATGAKP
jgi:lysophospholipase L1-like esterase